MFHLMEHNICLEICCVIFYVSLESYQAMSYVLRYVLKCGFLNSMDTRKGIIQENYVF